MALIPCFDKVSDPDLRKEFEKRVAGIDDEEQQREIGKKLLNETHQKLHDQLNGIREKVGVQQIPYTKPKTGSASDIKKLNKVYDAKVAEVQRGGGPQNITGVSHAVLNQKSAEA
jgi:hypothetical protein